jgi:hypothetical protein
MKAIPIGQAVAMIEVMLRDRAPDAKVTTDVASIGINVKATWERLGMPEVKLGFKFAIRGETVDLRIFTFVSAGGRFTPSGMVTLSRLTAEVAALACEVETMFSESVCTLTP